MRIVFRLILVLGILVLGTVALGNMAERWIIYPFDSTEVSPTSVGLPEVRAHRQSVGASEVVIWSTKAAENKPTLFYLHGNAGNLASRSGRFKRFIDRGYGLVAMGYRGSSGSDGSPSEEALISDAIEVYDSIAENTALVIYGESLGTAVSIALADRIAPRKPAAIVLEAPFTSIPDLAEFHYPGTGAMAEKISNTWHSIDRAETALDVRLLILHGTNDTLIPIEQGRQIFSAAPTSNKDFFAVKGAGHSDLWRSDTLPRLWRFIDQSALR